MTDPTMVRVVSLDHEPGQRSRELALRVAFPGYVVVVPSPSGMVSFVRGEGGTLIGVLAPPTIVPVSALPLVRVASGAGQHAMWDAIRAAVPGGRDLSVAAGAPCGVPCEIRDQHTQQVLGLLLWEEAPAAAPPSPSTPPATERSAPPPRIRALAMQLFYVQYDYAVRVREGRTPGLYSVPTDWSQADAVRWWDSMPEDGQQAWLRFAEEIAVYAGHPVYEPGPVGPMRIVPQLASVRWMARAAQIAGEGPEPPAETWNYLATELGTPLLGTPWAALVRDVYRDAYEQAVARAATTQAVLAATVDAPALRRIGHCERPSCEDVHPPRTTAAHAAMAPPKDAPARRVCYCNSQSCDAEHPNDRVRR